MKVKSFLMIVTLILVSGCSSKFAYKNLDWLAHWYIDDYILLTEEQRVVVDQKIAIWLAWHQQEELPRYLTDLNKLTSDIDGQQLSFAKLDAHQDTIKQHWARMKAKLVPDLVLMAPLLDSQQIAYLFEKLDKRNAEERKEIDETLSLSPKQQQDAVVKKYKKNITRWLGDLTPEQKTLAANIYGELQDNDALWLDYRQRYQAELKAVFEEPDRGDSFSERLFQLMMEPDVFRSDELNKINAENAVKFKKILLAINNTATVQQREKLITEINKFARDAEALIQN
ncbi:MAG: hypothetical protein ACJAUT_000479 [Cellvibrionaceae bacterium]|jgi:uncharacterized protein YeaO (DUF488 family)